MTDIFMSILDTWGMAEWISLFTGFIVGWLIVSILQKIKDWFKKKKKQEDNIDELDEWYKQDISDMTTDIYILYLYNKTYKGYILKIENHILPGIDSVILEIPENNNDNETVNLLIKIIDCYKNVTIHYDPFNCHAVVLLKDIYNKAKFNELHGSDGNEIRKKKFKEYIN